MSRSPFFVLILLAGMANVHPTTCFAQEAQEAQEAQSGGGRRILSKTVPAYPAIARTLNLTGAVKLEVLVQASGSVKSVQVKGGNPLLAQSAQNAIHGWKWEKTDHESTELVEFRFNP
jgi:TonB family protein